MTRALVLGGAGFIGVAVCKELMRRGVETVAAGRTARAAGVFTSYVAFDRTDERQLRRALDQVAPDVLLDLDVGSVCALACDLRKDATRRSYNVALEGVT